MLISFNDIKGNVRRYLARQKQKRSVHILPRNLEGLR
jgi:hypothetical protein